MSIQQVQQEQDFQPYQQLQQAYDRDNNQYVDQRSNRSTYNRNSQYQQHRSTQHNNGRYNYRGRNSQRHNYQYNNNVSNGDDYQNRQQNSFRSNNTEERQKRYQSTSQTKLNENIDEVQQAIDTANIKNKQDLELDQDNNEVQISRKTDEEQLQMQAEEEEANCVLCCEKLEIVSIGCCNHKKVCALCTLRLRLLTHNNKCPLCNQVQDRVLLLVLRKRLPNFEEVEYDLNNPDIWFFKKSWAEGVYVRKEKAGRKGALPIYVQLLRQSQLCCMICVQGSVEKDQTKQVGQANGPYGQNHQHPHERIQQYYFKTLAEVMAHLKSMHQRRICNTCFRSATKFCFEMETYSNKELTEHQKKSHEFCEYCNNYYYTLEELYKHMTQNHFTCYVCEQIGIQHQFFKDHKHLREHLRSDHFLCPNSDCTECMTAFASEQQLKQHQRQEHTTVDLQIQQINNLENEQSSQVRNQLIRPQRAQRAQLSNNSNSNNNNNNNNNSNIDNTNTPPDAYDNNIFDIQNNTNSSSNNNININNNNSNINNNNNNNDNNNNYNNGNSRGSTQANIRAGHVNLPARFNTPGTTISVPQNQVQGQTYNSMDQALYNQSFHAVNTSSQQDFPTLGGTQIPSQLQTNTRNPVQQQQLFYQQQIQTQMLNQGQQQIRSQQPRPNQNGGQPQWHFKSRMNNAVPEEFPSLPTGTNNNNNSSSNNNNNNNNLQGQSQTQSSSVSASASQALRSQAQRFEYRNQHQNQAQVQGDDQLQSNDINALSSINERGKQAKNLVQLASKTARCACGRKIKRITILGGQDVPELACDSECERDKRNRQLADAFGVEKDSSFQNPFDSHVSAHYKPQILLNYLIQPSNIVQLEQRLVDFIHNKSQPSLEFEPQDKNQREMVHLMAENMVLDTKSVGKGDNRRVVVTKTQNTKAPFKKVFQQVASLSYEDIKSMKDKLVLYVVKFRHFEGSLTQLTEQDIYRILRDYQDHFNLNTLERGIYEVQFKDKVSYEDAIKQLGGGVKGRYRVDNIGKLDQFSEIDTIDIQDLKNRNQNNQRQQNIT